ncbi:glycosyltransferase [Silvibacterium acidisoli]|uniref:glycosyltransferase n=1 Tax=Acidobacteriaceae bacterium ZG23-2 TaxID=2883246 RepID=UPI00406C4096
MSKLAINLLRWSNPWEEIETCIAAVLNSTFQDFILLYTENPHPTASSLEELVKIRFAADTRLRIRINDENTGYAGAHNQFFFETDNEFLMVLNPDAVLHPGFLAEILIAFENPFVGAATGKMVKPLQPPDQTRILDGTGIILYRTRRARERGQLDADHGQFDRSREVFGVSGTAAVFRKQALEEVKLGASEYFDHDFFAYWEDFDLSWRLRLAGYSCQYVPSAVVSHSRAVGVSPGGLIHFVRFVRHHRSFPVKIRRWSWRNHLLSIIKNDFGWCLVRDLPLIVGREVATLAFICLFMPDTLPAIPEFLRLLPSTLQKRRLIQQRRRIGSKEAARFIALR